jgi:hypothetical protein
VPRKLASRTIKPEELKEPAHCDLCGELADGGTLCWGHRDAEAAWPRPRTLARTARLDTEDRSGHRAACAGIVPTSALQGRTLVFPSTTQAFGRVRKYSIVQVVPVGFKHV